MWCLRHDDADHLPAGLADGGIGVVGLGFACCMLLIYATPSPFASLCGTLLVDKEYDKHLASEYDEFEGEGNFLLPYTGDCADGKPEGDGV